MADPIFVDGVPAPITVQDFLRYHLQQFPKMSSEANQEIVQNAIESVYAIFAGVSKLWESSDRQLWYSKTVECYRLLTAWYIADLYPTMLRGVPVMGGVPLKSKKIGDVSITFQDPAATAGSYKDVLASLRSNPFGAKAYLMITTGVKRYKLRARNYI